MSNYLPLSHGSIVFSFISLSVISDNCKNWCEICCVPKIFLRSTTCAVSFLDVNPT